MTLKSLTFIDLYLGVDDALISGVPNTSDPVLIPEAQKEEARLLRIACLDYQKSHPETKDFPIRHADVSYRASIMKTVKETVFVLRRLAETVKKLNELGIPPVLLEAMMQKGLTGLFVISGAFGQGKTTTASALVVSRIALYGGVAVTVEEPPEMPMEGRHGEGVCFQTWVDKGGFAEASRLVARWAPSIIFLGEIRDPETAIEALRASINGRLVVCTAHADNPVMAIQRIFSLAVAEGSSAEDVSNMLSSGIVAVVHQNLENTGSRRQLKIESIFFTGEDGLSGRAIIRSRKFEQLKSMLDLQRNRMIVTGRKAA